MAFFARKSGPERVRSAARRDGPNYNPKTAAELDALIAGPITDELVDLLLHLADGGAYYKIAREALDACGHPKAVARLLNRIDYGQNQQEIESVAVCFRYPPNAMAAGVVERLSQIANGSNNFHQVRGALRALGLIGSAEARETLRLFDEQTARNLCFDSGFDEDANEMTYIYRSSAFLGQRPDVGQLAYAQAKLREANPFIFGSLTEVERLLPDCLREPDGRWILREQLRTAIVDGFSWPYKGFCMPGMLKSNDILPPNALWEMANAAHVSWPSRLERLRTILAEEDTSRLEAFLLNKFADGFLSDLPFYQALPRKRPITELYGLDHPFTTLEEVEEYGAGAPRRRALERIAQARARPNDAEFRLTELVETYTLLPAEMCSTVVNEFIAPLLADTRWASRRMAIKALADLPLEEAASLLERFLKSGETDVELVSYARDALER